MLGDGAGTSSKQDRVIHSMFCVQADAHPNRQVYNYEPANVDHADMMEPVDAMPQQQQVSAECRMVSTKCCEL